VSGGTALPPARPWLVRTYRNGDERQLVGLFERVFGRAMSEAQWRWKLRRPSAIENVWLALQDGRAIFQCAGIPTPFSLPSGPATIVVAVDAMTDPDFRRRGLLTAVARDAYDSWRAAGSPFVLGLPNEQWGSRAAALGWQKLFPLQWLVRVIRPTALATRKLGLGRRGGLDWLDRGWGAVSQALSPPDRTVTSERVLAAGAEFDRFWTNVEPGVRYSVRRDASWVTWRYLSPPDLRYVVLAASRKGDICGWVAIRLPAPPVSPTLGTIADLVVRPGDGGARSALIEAAIKTARAEGIEAVASLAVPGTPLYRGLRRAGFFRHWGAFSVECVPLGASLDLTDMQAPSNWLIAGGDFDVV
jgi:Acetyltransferase (GNAT) domain